MKTKEELNEIREEVEAVKEKLKALSEEELEAVAGGMKVYVEEDQSWLKTIADLFFKVNK